MRKFLFVMATAVALTGCSKDDEATKLSLNKTLLSIPYDKSEKLTANQDVIWKSQDSYFATVDKDGLVKGTKVGKTTIFAQSGKEEAKCEVEITPSFDTFVEPIFEFGTSISDIKRKEKRPLLKEDKDALLFKGNKASEKGVVYLFENGKLNGAAISLGLSYATDIMDFLLERYTPIGKTDNDTFLFINASNPNKATMGIGLSVESGYIMVTYVDVTNTKTTNNNTENSIKATMKQSIQVLKL